MDLKLIESKILEIFFCPKPEQFRHCYNLQGIIELILKKIDILINYYKENELFYWKIIKLRSFYNQILKIITEDE